MKKIVKFNNIKIIKKYKIFCINITKKKLLKNFIIVKKQGKKGILNTPHSSEKKFPKIKSAL